MAIEAVVFDMDGVLIDAKEWHYEALNRALALFGFEISRTDHLTSFDGLPTRKKLEMLSSTDGLPTRLHGFINAMKQAYTMEIIYQKCKPMFHHEYALSRLKSRGLKLAVASNSVRDSVETMMMKSKLSDYMDIMLSNEDVSRPKPDPEIYLVAMEQLGVRPETTLIVEDNEHGIRAAQASGAHLLKVRDVYDVTLSAIAQRITEIESAA